MTSGLRLTFAFEVGPVAQTPREISGALGDALQSLLTTTHSEAFGTKTNVAVTELVTNVLEHAGEGTGTVRCEVALEANTLRIRVQGDASEEQCTEVLQRVDTLSTATDPKALLRSTLKERHAKRLKGGVGLLRLRAENGFSVRAERIAQQLAITVEYAEGGAQ